jgi:hypothetical protein
VNSVAASFRRAASAFVGLRGQSSTKSHVLPVAERQHSQRGGVDAGFGRAPWFVIQTRSLTDHLRRLTFSYMTNKQAKLPKDAVLSFRVSTSLRDALAKAAQADDRSVSAYTIRLIEHGLREKGFIK